jgi:group I intron endonuclease
MIAGIYRLRNRVSNEMYIGATNNLTARRCQHLGKLRRGINTKRIQRSHDIYGENSMAFEVLLVCDTRDLSFYEDIALKAFRPALNAESKSLEYEVWRTPGAKYQVRPTS